MKILESVKQGRHVQRFHSWQPDDVVVHGRCHGRTDSCYLPLQVITPPTPLHALGVAFLECDTPITR